MRRFLDRSGNTLGLMKYSPRRLELQMVQEDFSGCGTPPGNHPLDARRARSDAEPNWRGTSPTTFVTAALARSRVKYQLRCDDLCLNRRHEATARRGDCGKRVPGCWTARAKLVSSSPMLLLRTEKLPQGGLWVYELSSTASAPRLSRAAAESTSGRATTRTSTPGTRVVQALAAMPDETVIDGEIVAMTNRAGHHSTRSRTSDPARQHCSITYST